MKTKQITSAALLAVAVIGCGHHEEERVSADAEAVFDYVPPPPPPAPVDAAPSLAAQVASRTEDARARFGASTRVQVIGDMFVMVEIGAPSPTFEKAAALITRVLLPLREGHFRAGPPDAVTVLVFTDAKRYVDYCDAIDQPSDDLGLYRPAVREIAADVSHGEDYLPTFAHEIVHPLIEADFPRVPMWFNEGLASLFEAPVFAEDGTIHGAPKDWRDVDWLQPAFASETERKLLHVDALFGMSPRTFKRGVDRATGEAAGEIVGVHYALVRSVCAWMDAQGTLWPFYEAWRDGYADDRTGEKAFAKATGMTPKEADAAWRKWVR